MEYSRSEERLAYFQTQIQDIRDYKANQWRYSNYGVLIQAALTAVDINLGDSLPWAPYFLVFISGVTCIVICWLIYEAATQIYYSRLNYEYLMKQTKESFHDTYGKFQDWKDELTPSLSQVLTAARPFAWLFPLIQVIAWALAFLVIVFASP